MVPSQDSNPQPQICESQIHTSVALPTVQPRHPLKLLLSTLSVLSNIYVPQCTIVDICPGTADSSEIIIQGQIVSAAEDNNNG